MTSTYEGPAMTTTVEILKERFGTSFIPLDAIRDAFFPEMGPDRFRRALITGDIQLPAMRLRGSQKAREFVDVRDLATWYDGHRAAAQRQSVRMKIAA